MRIYLLKLDFKEISKKYVNKTRPVVSLFLVLKNSYITLAEVLKLAREVPPQKQTSSWGEQLP